MNDGASVSTTANKYLLVQSNVSRENCFVAVCAWSDIWSIAVDRLTAVFFSYSRCHREAKPWEISTFFVALANEIASMHMKQRTGQEQWTNRWRQCDNISIRMDDGSQSKTRKQKKIVSDAHMIFMCIQTSKCDRRRRTKPGIREWQNKLRG